MWQGGDGRRFCANWTQLISRCGQTVGPVHLNCTGPTFCPHRLIRALFFSQESYEVIWNLEGSYQLWRHMQDLNSLEQTCSFHMTDTFLMTSTNCGNRYSFVMFSLWLHKTSQRQKWIIFVWITGGKHHTTKKKFRIWVQDGLDSMKNSRSKSDRLFEVVCM